VTGLTPRCDWKRSSFHVPTDRRDCVEVRQYGDGVVGVRDARHADTGVAYMFDPETWRNFVAGVKAGEFDLEDGGRDVSRAPLPPHVEPLRPVPGMRLPRPATSAAPHDRSQNNDPTA
jgi:hypothetical protein